MVSDSDIALLAVAGACAGLVGSAGGTASLISYPALLAVGLPPLQANVTNSVAFVANLPGSALGSRPELRGRGAWVLRWGLVVAAGGAVGAVLLLVTPQDVFNRVVPFLVALAALALLFQPRISAWESRRSLSHSALVLPCGLAAVAVYNGYWGAGSGVMTLAVLLLAVERDFARANALKNMLLGAGDLPVALIFALFGPVVWSAALPMAAGWVLGSRFGPSITRRVPGDAIRVVVALAGLGLAGEALGRAWVTILSHVPGVAGSSAKVLHFGTLSAHFLGLGAGRIRTYVRYAGGDGRSGAGA